ncbi:MAG: tetratricopeptide repeat protein [Elusimicrobiota bacterium]
MLRLLTAFLFAWAAAMPTAFAKGSAGQPGELFTFGAGARALGMGSACTAVVRDVASVYYNPAGLGLLPSREITLMRAKLFEGATYDYIGYAQNKRKRAGGWGFELIRFGVGDAEGRDEFNNPTGGFSYSEMALGLAHGWRGILHPKLSAGAKLKMLQRDLGGSKDKLYGADVGVQWGPWLGGRLMLGAVALNAVGLAQGDTDDKLNPLIRAGAAYQIVGPLALAMDVSDSGEFRVGTEYAWGITALRVGMADEALSFGGGLMFRNRYKIDFALMNHSELGMSQRISIGYRFDSPRDREGARVPRMRAYATEHLNNAVAELKKRNYLKASQDMDTAHGIDPGVSGAEWKPQGERLKRLIKAMELETHPEDQEAFQENAPAAFVAYQAVQAYIGNEEDRAMLLAHAAQGSDPRRGAYRRLLDAVGKLTGREKKDDEILPPARLAALKMKLGVEAVYRRQFAPAAQLLREALWLEPNNAKAWTRLGSAYFGMGDKQRAAAAYRKALEFDPADEKLRRFMEAQGL